MLFLLFSNSINTSNIKKELISVVKVSIPMSFYKLKNRFEHFTTSFIQHNFYALYMSVSG